MAACSVSGCDRPMKARSYCSTHYKRWLTHGDPGAAVIRVRRYEGSCSVDGCTTPARRRGMCGTHCARVERRGSAGAAELEHAVSYDGCECAVDGCHQRPKSRGWCAAHYKRWRRWGSPTGSRSVQPADVRFDSNVAVGTAPAHRPGLGPCWLWTRPPGKHGYGYFRPTNGVYALAHRWAYQRARGAIPPGMVIDHLCRVRVCVNPQHLEAVTNFENLRRGAGYGLQNGMRSKCINGHRYTTENTYTAPDGGIRCRTCARIRPRKKAA